MNSIRTLMVSAAVLFATPTLAADNGVSVSIGTFENSDEQYQLFSTNYHMLQMGLQGSYAIHDRIAVIGSLRTHRTGQEVYIGDEYMDDSALVAAYSANTLGVGLKADIQPLKFLQLFVASQALLYHATMRFDDDASSRTNAGQVQSSGFSGGVEATAGLELKIHPRKLPISFGWYNEFGLGVIANHSFKGAKDVNGTEDSFASDAYLGDMAPGGFVFRSGLGVRF